MTGHWQVVHWRGCPWGRPPVRVFLPFDEEETGAEDDEEEDDDIPW